MRPGVITVVLPVYGVETYLDRSVMSVVNQTYRNLEILLVDDGSPDRCPAMCDDWARRDDRIRVIHKANAGLGMARNTGIENATGEYICFFDSDDSIAPEAIEKAYATANRERSDVVVFGMAIVDDRGQTIRSVIPESDRITYDGMEVQSRFLPELIAGREESPLKGLQMSACSCLYSMELIRRSGWRFASEREIISEDVYSLLDLYRHINRVSVLPEALYYYRINQQSLTHRYVPNRYEKVRHFYLESLKLCRTCGYSEEILHRMSEPYLSFTIAAMKQEAGGPLPEKEKKEKLKRIIEDGVLQQVLLQNRKDAVKPARWILFFVIRRRWYPLCRLLLNLQNRRGG